MPTMMKDDKGTTKQIGMSTRNGEIATSNNGGIQKAHWKHPKEHKVGYEKKT
jgi:hypothetical protein